MKDYIRKVSNEEIAGWIVDYLAEIGWGLNNPYKNLQNVEDLYIDRCKGNFVATLYFDHPHKEYSHQETVYYHSDIPGVDIREEINMIIYGDSYNLEAIRLESSAIQKFAFEESTSVAEDLKRYWQSKMYWKFKDEGYLDNLNKYEEKLQQEIAEKANASEIGL